MPDDQAAAPKETRAAMARLLEPTVAAASLKTSPDDFQVEEELGFALSGVGEHLCIQVEKTGLSTIEAAGRLREATGLRQSDIGYAGMKDKRARTTQWFSLRLPHSQESKLYSAQDESLRIRQSSRNHRKIRIGSHRANRFAIQLRDFRGDRDDMERRLQFLNQHGVPNYFGPQRFGRLYGNLDRVDRCIRDGERGKVRARISRTERSLLYSAARAWLFNQVLSTRLAHGNWNRYLPGDVMSLDGSGRPFLQEAGACDDDLRQRLDSLDIHVTGPLPGAVTGQLRYVTRAQAADIENAVLLQNSAMLAWLEREGLQAGRRPLRFALRELDRVWTEDGLKLHFVLARGCYATSLIRELCITDGSEQETKLEP